MTSLEREIPDSFGEWVSDAYDHLHDIVYLGDHPLADHLLMPIAKMSPGRQLHDLLRSLIDDLDGGPDMPPFGPEWRRHRYMVLRYLRGQSHQTIADTFHIGLRQYYRLRRSIIAEVSEILWSRRQAATDFDTTGSNDSTRRLGLLREESQRMAQSGSLVPISQVLQGVGSLIQVALAGDEGHFSYGIAPDLSATLLPEGVLRQVLLSMITCLRHASGPIELQLHARRQGDQIVVICERLGRRPGGMPDGLLNERLSELGQLASAADYTVAPRFIDEYLAAIELSVPFVERTVLCIDDNQDLLALMRGYLQPHGYRVYVANTAAEGLELARIQQPGTIVLDIMMPDHDGWEILQRLVTDPDTRKIPVIVCSILRQGDLALDLGATSYLPKPITQHSLLAALAEIQER